MRELNAARLLPGTLARFLDGMTWPEIHALDPTVHPLWWSYAVGNAEDAGDLVWIAGMWVLTDRGRELIREVA